MRSWILGLVNLCVPKLLRKIDVSLILMHKVITRLHVTCLLAAILKTHEIIQILRPKSFDTQFMTLHATVFRGIVNRESNYYELAVMDV